MKVVHTKNSRKDFQKLSLDIREIAEKQFKIFINNPAHPSLGIKKIQGTENIWEGRITKSIRFSFQIYKDVYIIRRIGGHDEVLNRP
jgi:mRNA-degrading endonuclease RelE of RelBE toxin-antitoxin system